MNEAGRSTWRTSRGATGLRDSDIAELFRGSGGCCGRVCRFLVALQLASDAFRALLYGAAGLVGGFFCVFADDLCAFGCVLANGLRSFCRVFANIFGAGLC